MISTITFWSTTEYGNNVQYDVRSRDGNNQMKAPPSHLAIGSYVLFRIIIHLWYPFIFYYVKPTLNLLAGSSH